MSPPSLVEADWPDAYRVNCFVRRAGDDATAGDALADFHRIPTWMWRNTVIVDLGKLRTLNSRASRSVGFYGLDLYSLHLDGVRRPLPRDRRSRRCEARQDRFGCFERFRSEGDGQAYGYAAEVGDGERCEDEVVAQLVELRSRATELSSGNGGVAEDRRSRRSRTRASS